MIITVFDVTTRRLSTRLCEEKKKFFLKGSILVFVTEKKFFWGKRISFQCQKKGIFTVCILK